MPGLPVPLLGGEALTLDLSDSVTVSDAQAKDVGLALSDTQALSDALTSAEGNDLVLGDSVTVTDTDTETLGVAWTQSLSDAVTVGDSATYQQAQPFAPPVPAGGWKPLRLRQQHRFALTDTVYVSDEIDTDYTEGIPTRRQKRELALLA